MLHFKSIYLQISPIQCAPEACHFLSQRSSTHNEARFHLTIRKFIQTLKPSFKKDSLLPTVTLALLVAIFTRTIGNYVEAGEKKKSFIMNTTFSDCK